MPPDTNNKTCAKRAIHALECTRKTLIHTNRDLTHAHDCLRTWRQASTQNASEVRPLTAQDLTAGSILHVEDSLRQIGNQIHQLMRLYQLTRKE